MVLAARFTAPSDITDYDFIKVTEVDKPKPEDIPEDCVLVKIQAASINPVDSLVVNGAVTGFGWSLPLPFTPAYDFCGTVEHAGKAVSNVSVGDQVFGVNWGVGNHDVEPSPGGAFAEYMTVKASIVSKKAENVSTEQAAAIGLVGTTAYQACTNVGVFSGDTKRILVLGGSSSVGSLAIQLAKQQGCFVATTCSKRTKEYVESFKCADKISDDGAEKWWELPELKGIDAVLDVVGEAEALEHAKLILRSDGYFATIVTHAYVSTVEIRAT